MMQSDPVAPLLQVTALHKHFGGVCVSDGVNLAVGRGHICALIGPNGAGKTSVINQLSGAIQPDSGEIRYLGQLVQHWPVAKRAKSGLLRAFQITQIFPELSVAENIMVAMHLHQGRAANFWRASPQLTLDACTPTTRLMLAAFNLERHWQAPAATLSHGARKTLELAMVMAQSPQCLLLDEPLAGLTPAESAVMIRNLHAIKQDCAIILVEHDMAAVFTLADEILVLDRGRIIAQGTADAIRGNALVQQVYLGHGPTTGGQHG